MKFSRYVVAAFSILASNNIVFAGSPPQQLHNKSITLFWTESNTWKRISDGVSGSSTPSHNRVIYISGAGRPFVLEKGKSGTAGGKFEVGPEKMSGRFTFDGNKMMNFMGREGLLWRIAVSFDPSFSSCTASVNIAKEGPNAKVTGMDGAPYEITGTSVGAVTCSIKEGNAVAG